MQGLPSESFRHLEALFHALMNRITFHPINAALELTLPHWSTPKIDISDLLMNEKQAILISIYAGNTYQFTVFPGN